MKAKLLIVFLFGLLGLVAAFHRPTWHSSPTDLRRVNTMVGIRVPPRYDANANGVASIPRGGQVQLLFAAMGVGKNRVLARLEAGEWVRLNPEETGQIQDLAFGEVYWDTETLRTKEPHLYAIELLLHFRDFEPGSKIELSFRDDQTSWPIHQPESWGSNPVAAGWRKDLRYYLAGASLTVLHSARLEASVKFYDPRRGDCVAVFHLPPLLSIPTENEHLSDLFDLVIPEIEFRSTREMQAAITNYAQVYITPVRSPIREGRFSEEAHRCDDARNC